MLELMLNVADDAVPSAVQTELLTDSCGSNASCVTVIVLLTLKVVLDIVTVAVLVDTTVLAFAVRLRLVEPLDAEVLSNVSHDASLVAVQGMLDVIDMLLFSCA